MSEQESKLYALYQAVHLMMARLGADGEIDTRAPEVDAVMDAMHEYDGGQYIQWNRRTPQPVTPAASKLERALQSAYDHGVTGAPFPMVDCLRQLAEPVTPAGGEVVTKAVVDLTCPVCNSVSPHDVVITEHPPVADAALLARAERLHSAIVDAISIHDSFDTTADMADWLHDELDAALNQRGGGEFPECTGQPTDCPENDGHGCCKGNGNG